MAKFTESLDVSIIIDSTLKLLGGALGVKLFDMWLKKRAKKRELIQKDIFINNLKEIAVMNHHMTDVIEHTPVDRFLILMGHDSGNIPNPKHPYYAKAMWQKVKNEYDDDSLTRKFDSVRVDLDYINMIIELMIKGCLKIEVDKMPNCFLKTVYQSEGIKYSELYFLAQEKGHKIYYCSVATVKDNERFDDANVRLKIQIAVDKIRGIFSKL